MQVIQQQQLTSYRVTKVKNQQPKEKKKEDKNVGLEYIQVTISFHLSLPPDRHQRLHREPIDQITNH